MSKKPKNRRKLLRMNCPACGAGQNSLHPKCTSCGETLYTDADSIGQVSDMVDTLEELLRFLETPTMRAGSPYKPVDRSFGLLRDLRRYMAVPGMPDYLKTSRRTLLPFKVRLLRNQLKANVIFAVVLVAFPTLPLVLGWPPMIALLMLMPAAVWLVVTGKAWIDLNKAKKELNALE